MSQFDGSTHNWQEDYRRVKREERSATRQCQLLANAVNASSNGRLDIAADALAEAKRLHASHDRVHDHIVDAESALDAAEASDDDAAVLARTHTREAAQLLHGEIDDSLAFDSGGAFS